MNIEMAKKQADQALEELANALERGKSENLKSFLAAMGRFHRYSVWNAMLISFQRPNATHVAGFWNWKRLGRKVKKGEKSIVILAPIVRRERKSAEAESQEAAADVEKVLAFRRAHVFDISQTEGKPLPELTQAQGDPAGYTERLKKWIAGKGVRLEYSDRLGTADGLSAGGRIVLRQGMVPAEEFSVLVHESAHELLHRDDKAKADRKVRETEAEAVAFVVSEAIGLDANHASSDYIQLYQGSKEMLKESLGRIRSVAVEMLGTLTVQACNKSGVGEEPSAGQASSRGHQEVRAAAA